MRKLLSGGCSTFLALALLTVTVHAADSGGLNILVYGASGKVGSHVVTEGLDRGHRVTAVSRDPSRIKRVHERLSVVKGDVLDPQSVASLVAGQDVVVISVRGTVGKSRDPADTVAFMAVKNTVEALRDIEDSTPRLIHVGGSGSLEIEPNVLLADRLPKILLPKSLEVEIAGQVMALDYLRAVTDIAWSYATPAKNFTNGKRTGEFRIGGDPMMEDSRGRSRISRADFAVALIDEAENAEHVQRRFSVAY